MLIIGARGFATEVLEVLYKQGITDIAFYDDVNKQAPDMLFDKFPVLKNISSAEQYFRSTDDRFVLGLGGPEKRAQLNQKMLACGGRPATLISSDALIGHFGNTIKEGVCIMPGAIISNNVHIGTGTLINVHTSIGHDTKIGDFCELSPYANITGNCTIGNHCTIGSSVTILPNLSITHNVIIGAMSLVTKDIKVPGTYIGIPVKKIL